MEKFRQHLDRCLNTMAIRVSQQQSDRLSCHASELMTWNLKINLTAIKDPMGVAEKHFFDSIAASAYLKNVTSLIDIGSGGGFPGIPIKIMNPGLKVILIDASQKKVSFLKHVIRMLKLDNINAVQARVEDLIVDRAYQSQFDGVISRAFSDLENFVSLAWPLAGHNGQIYAMKGKQAKMEMTPALSERFACDIHHYLLPFEKSERYVIRLCAKHGSNQNQNQG